MYLEKQFMCPPPSKKSVSLLHTTPARSAPFQTERNCLGSPDSRQGLVYTFIVLGSCPYV